MHWPTLAAGFTHLILFSAEPLASGALSGLDRLPAEDLLAEARAATRAAGSKLLVCFGGNGRSAGFSAMTRSKTARGRFVKAAVALVRSSGLDGVDLNWEYPGFAFVTGYREAEVAKDWAGLARLARELRAALPAAHALTLAYYPDGRQEQLLLSHGLPDSLDLMHAMAYDANEAGGHSTLELAERAMDGAARAGLPLHKVTLGLPFYGRDRSKGDWTTYEDIVQQAHPLDPARDSVLLPDGRTTAFNGRATIAAKTRSALARGLGGVMVWEAGQDCRLVAVRRGDTTHAVTCPEGERSSLLVAVREAARGGAKGGDSEEL